MALDQIQAGCGVRRVLIYIALNTQWCSLSIAARQDISKFATDQTIAANDQPVTSLMVDKGREHQNGRRQIRGTSHKSTAAVVLALAALE
jgi:hypothetical protein